MNQPTDRVNKLTMIVKPKNKTKCKRKFKMQKVFFNGELFHIKKDLTGDRFSRLVITGLVGFSTKRVAIWSFICDCGVMGTVKTSHLNYGSTKSCGCLQVDSLKKHGLTGTKIYRAWNNMIDRCYNKKYHHYKHYGGRGIKICDRWRDSFINFFSDMGEPPSKKHSLDRFPDKDGNYEPGNCRWATATQQIRNRVSTLMYEIDKVSKSLPEWAEIYNKPYRLVYKRICSGWDIIKARYGIPI